MSKLQVVVGGQFGSESKGAVTGWLAQQAQERDENTVVVRVAGPNAGHTAYDSKGRKWALRQIPVAAVTSRAQLVIGAGSEIDPPVLQDEITRLEAAGIPITDRLMIDASATVLVDKHKEAESADGLVSKIGSTGKGIGAARADRLMRGAMTWGDYAPTAAQDTTVDLYECLATDWTVIIEGTQGYGLGLHTEHYPQVTSSDCRAIDFLAMAGISPWQPGVTDFQVWVVARAFPIRVAGNSGPLKGETTWDELGLPAELTTVTQKVRRVGEWDDDLLLGAILANGGGVAGGPVRLAYSMADQRYPSLAGLHGPMQDVAPKLDERQITEMSALLMNLIRFERMAGTPVAYIGTGPDTRIWKGEFV